MSDNGETPRALGAVLDEALLSVLTQGDSSTRSAGLPTGFARLDRLCGGLHAGELVVLAARPGMGKTALALAFALNASAEAPVIYFTLETSRSQLALHLLCAEALIDAGRLHWGTARTTDWTRLTHVASRLSRLPICIDDTPAPSVCEIRSAIEGVHGAASGPGLVVIDSLQAMGKWPDGDGGRSDAADNCRGLKHLAQDLGLAVLVLTDLPAHLDERLDKRPRLVDLRASGALRHADAVLFLHRDEYYFSETPNRGESELTVAKLRSGRTGTVRLRFVHEHRRFEEPDPGADIFDDFDDVRNAVK